MAWVRIEDAVTEHRKHLRAGPAACWLWVCGIAYCQRQLSDGFIPSEALGMLGVAKGALKLAGQLVTVGLFDAVDGGYLVHDYHDYNDTREEAHQRRANLSAARAKAGRIGGLHSGSKRQANAKQTQTPVAEAKRSPFPSLPIPEERTSAAAAPRHALAEAPNQNGNYKVIEALACTLRKAGFWEVGEGIRFDIQSEAELVCAVKDVCAQQRIVYSSHPDVEVDTVHRACASAWGKPEKRAARA